MSRFDSTHWSVVIGAADGSVPARDRFCRTYGPVIGRYLAARWRLPKNHDQVAEATQEVFLECFKEHGALGRVDPERSFRAFLYGVTSNTAAVLERRSRRSSRDHAIPEFDPDRVEQDEKTLSQVFDRALAQTFGREARELFAERSARNDPARRRARCLEARYQRGLPPREIARELDVAVERVYEMLHQAKAEYRSALLDVVGHHHPGATKVDLERLCAELAGHL